MEFIGFTIDLKSTLIVVTSIVSAVIGLVVFRQDRNSKTNYYFFLLSLAVALWGALIVFYRGFDDPEVVTFLSRILYASATFIPLSFAFFAYVYPQKNILVPSLVSVPLILTCLVLVIVSILPEGLITGIQIHTDGSERIIIFEFYQSLLYASYILGCFGVGFGFLFRKYLISEGLLRKQVLFLILATSIPTSISGVTNLILPFFGYFELNWVGQVSTVVLSIVIMYAIFRLGVFNVKLIATEIFMFLLWSGGFASLLLSNSVVQTIVSSTIFFMTIVIGILLLRSVMSEVSQREKMESLAQELAQKNAELDELNKRKTEFVSFANHQLRTPLQAINGYTSLLLDGSYGEVSERQRGALEKNLEAGQLMSLTIDDFLNIAKIELNKIEYIKERRDLRELVDTVSREQRLPAEKKGLTCTVKNYPQPLYAHIDFNKIKQVISNLLDNAVKYTKTGEITITLERSERVAKIILTDTGIGIPEGQIEKLFDKFSRASNANRGDNKGTGLGLYVAKQMIEAHGGTIVASSEGVGKGSTFTIRLPLV